MAGRRPKAAWTTTHPDRCRSTKFSVDCPPLPGGNVGARPECNCAGPAECRVSRAFYRTELDEILRKAGITHLIVTGCTTSICVESTIRDAFFRDYQCILLTDCTAEPIGARETRSNHDATLTVLGLMFARLSTSGEFIAALTSSAVRLAG